MRSCIRWQEDFFEHTRVIGAKFAARARGLVLITAPEGLDLYGGCVRSQLACEVCLVAIGDSLHKGNFLDERSLLRQVIEQHVAQSLLLLFLSCVHDWLPFHEAPQAASLATPRALNQRQGRARTKGKNWTGPLSLYHAALVVSPLQPTTRGGGVRCPLSGVRSKQDDLVPPMCPMVDSGRCPVHRGACCVALRCVLRRPG